MLNEFKQYLLGIGKSENTALNYCDKVKLYFKWCLDSFGSEPQQLYRANVLDYISYMKTIKRYNPKSVNNHLSSLRSFNEFLIASGRQTELAIVKNDFMKIQIAYANPCTVEQKDVEAFRQRLLEGGSKRDFAIVTLYTYTGIRRSECVNLRVDQVDLIAKEIYVVGNPAAKPLAAAPVPVAVAPPNTLPALLAPCPMPVTTLAAIKSSIPILEPVWATLRPIAAR